MEQDGVHVIHAVSSVGEYKGFVKAVVLRSTTFFYSKVPFAENSGLVLGSFHFMSNGPQPRGYTIAIIFCVGNAMHEFMLPSHNHRSSRCTGRRDVEVRQACTIGIKRIHMRRFHQRIAGQAHVSQPLVIGHDENDIGATSF